MTITYHSNIEQHSPEWYAIKCGILSASNISKIITPAKMQPVTTKDGSPTAYMYELLAQRITNYIEPTFQSFDMQRGNEEEVLARALYSEKIAPVQEMGFVTNDEWGFTLGCSPDGLVGEDGGIQFKSRANKYQVETILNDGKMPEYLLQIQTELLVTRRKWWDFGSYSNGMSLAVYRMYPDPVVQDAIVAGARAFHERLDALMKVYAEKTAHALIIPVERRIEQVMEITEESEAA
jgi:hypothetical protein